MPDAKQRAEDALGHLVAFEEGALADVKAELRKFIGRDDEAPADAPEAAPAAPAAPAPKPATGA